MTMRSTAGSRSRSRTRSQRERSSRARSSPAISSRARSLSRTKSQKRSETRSRSRSRHSERSLLVAEPVYESMAVPAEPGAAAAESVLKPVAIAGTLAAVALGAVYAFSPGAPVISNNTPLVPTDNTGGGTKAGTQAGSAAGSAAGSTAGTATPSGTSPASTGRLPLFGVFLVFAPLIVTACAVYLRTGSVFSAIACALATIVIAYILFGLNPPPVPASGGTSAAAQNLRVPGDGRTLAVGSVSVYFFSILGLIALTLFAIRGGLIANAPWLWLVYAALMVFSAYRVLMSTGENPTRAESAAKYIENKLLWSSVVATALLTLFIVGYLVYRAVVLGLQLAYYVAMALFALVVMLMMSAYTLMFTVIVGEASLDIVANMDTSTRLAILAVLVAITVAIMYTELVAGLVIFVVALVACAYMMPSLTQYDAAVAAGNNTPSANQTMTFDQFLGKLFNSSSN